MANVKESECSMSTQGNTFGAPFLSNQIGLLCGIDSCSRESLGSSPDFCTGNSGFERTDVRSGFVSLSILLLCHAASRRKVLQRQSGGQGGGHVWIHCPSIFGLVCCLCSAGRIIFFQGQCLKSFGFGRFDLGCVGIRSFHPLRRFRKCELFLSLISEVLLSHAAH